MTRQRIPYRRTGLKTDRPRWPDARSPFRMRDGSGWQGNDRTFREECGVPWPADCPYGRWCAFMPSSRINRSTVCFDAPRWPLRPRNAVILRRP